MPPSLRSKLLRVLQEREIERVGGRRRDPDRRAGGRGHAPRPAERVARGEFREDLYYRLRVRRDRAAAPARATRGHSRGSSATSWSASRRGRARDAPAPRPRTPARSLLGHDFPGNIRELENLLEGAARALAGGDDPARGPPVAAAAGPSAGRGGPGPRRGRDPGSAGPGEPAHPARAAPGGGKQEPGGPSPRDFAPDAVPEAPGGTLGHWVIKSHIPQ